ncbi:hypothetical protein SDC9_169801 [bioreactor metagenome]|uniref:Uncharacterized protein n=1 Tax=bioreactor metagenome TaxID=1076179 RepID=A0A645G6B6_9ZZZZ
MFADHCAAADGMDTDFVVRAPLIFLMTAKDKLFILGRNGGNRMRKHQRGAAGAVHLLAMMRFDDLDVKV